MGTGVGVARADKAGALRGFLVGIGARCFAAVASLIAGCFALASPAHAVVIDFENLQPTTVLSQYASAGVTFNGPRLIDYSASPGFAHSGGKAIEVCFAQEFCTEPLRIDFTADQGNVRVWVGLSSAFSQPAAVVLQAFDQNNALVGQVSATLPPSSGPTPVQTPLQISSAPARIRRVTLSFADGPSGPSANNGLVVDDVEFSTAGAEPPCSTTIIPTISLQLPKIATVSVDQFRLEGAIATPTPLLEAVLRVEGGGLPASLTAS